MNASAWPSRVHSNVRPPAGGQPANGPVQWSAKRPRLVTIGRNYHQVDVLRRAGLAVLVPDERDMPPVRRKRRADRRAAAARDLARIPTAGRHDPDIGPPLSLVAVGLAIGYEGDLLPIRRPGWLIVVPISIGDLLFFASSTSMTKMCVRRWSKKPIPSNL